MTKQSLIVPIAAQAVVVPENDKFNKLDLSNRSDAGNIVLGKDVQFDVESCFDQDKRGTLDKGVHIHWNIPKLLKHGTGSDEKEIEFPKVPNRWMVVRLETSESNLSPSNIKSKAWIIESNKINDDANDNWATIENNKYELSGVGRSLVWSEEYIDDHLDDTPLTALSALNPYFSNLYDESQDVFGFHDDMKDSDGVEIEFSESTYFTYVISGWYSPKGDDPLKADDDSILKNNIEAYWKLKNEQNDELINIEVADFESCLFHTNIFDVNWKRDIDDGIPHADVKVVLGNNTTDVLSALIINENTSETVPKGMEDYLNGLFNKCLEDESQVLSKAQVAIENHKRNFSAKNRSIIWQIVKKDQEHGSMLDGNTDDEKSPYFPLDKGLAKDLKSLNHSQLEVNRLHEELKCAQQAIYFHWYQCVEEKKVYEKDPGLEKEIKRIQNSITEKIGKIDQERSNLVHTYSEYIQRNLLSNDHNDHNSTAQYELIQTPEDRYWEPNEPTLLFFGDGLGNVSNFHRDLTDSLICRSSSEITSKLLLEHTISGNKNTRTVNTSIFDIEGVSALKNVTDFAGPDIYALLNEALLLSGNLWSSIQSSLDIQFSEDDIRNAQKDSIGHYVKFADPKHQQAWEPLFMLWKVDWVDQSESKSESHTLTGFTPLTTGAKNTVAEYTELNIAKKYQKTLWQNLSGFNSQLLAQYPHLQLPPLLYEVDEDGADSKLEIDTTVLETIDSTVGYKLAPNDTSDECMLTRNGSLHIKHLSLVDTFGRQKIIIKEGDTDQMIIVPSKLDDTRKFDVQKGIELDKRINVPTRINLDWVNSENEVIYQDSSAVDHPICGWLIPNFVDNQLLIYNSEGQEIKALRFGYNNAKNVIEEFYPINDGELEVSKLKGKRESQIDNDLLKIVRSIDLKFFLEHCNSMKKKLGANVQSNNNPIDLL